MSLFYDPTVCDLCGGKEYSILLELATGQVLRSDRVTIPGHLNKFICLHCGLVRSGQSLDEQELQNYYATDYTLSVQPEHYFYTSQGPISRSTMLCNWIITAMGTNHWQEANRCLEIGAGSGTLMKEFIRCFPQTVFEGIELNHKAVILAQQSGIPVIQGTLNDLGRKKYDVIYTVGVIEHVRSPTEFLQEIRKHLKPEGWLLLCQPTQDVTSYDLFFFDHLHHFGTEHLRQYARKCGFRERGFVVGYKWMPNFSLHLWQATEQVDDFAWVGPPGYTTCPFTASRIKADMTRLDNTLAKLAKEQRRVAVFGPSEVYRLAHAYSALGDFSIICGLDDQPDKPEFAHLKFPVVTPEDCLSLGVQDVILTMNKIYYAQAHNRLKKLGLVAHPVLS